MLDFYGRLVKQLAFVKAERNGNCCVENRLLEFIGERLVGEYLSGLLNIMHCDDGQ